MASNHGLRVQVVQDGPRRAATVSDAGIIVADLECWVVGDMTYVSDIWVEPEYRRRGIARALLDTLPGIVCLEVRTDNDAAIALYDSWGLRVLKRIPGYYKDGTDALYMEGTRKG